MPVDVVGERLREHARQAETPQLLCAPRVNDQLLLSLLIDARSTTLQGSAANTLARERGS
jgi:hypothetical protein